MTPSGECPPRPHEAVGDRPRSTTMPWGTTPCPPRCRGGQPPVHHDDVGDRPTGGLHGRARPQVHHDTVGDKPTGGRHERARHRVHHATVGDNPRSTTPPWGTPRFLRGMAVMVVAGTLARRRSCGARALSPERRPRDPRQSDVSFEDGDEGEGAKANPKVRSGRRPLHGLRPP